MKQSVLVVAVVPKSVRETLFICIQKLIFLLINIKKTVGIAGFVKLNARAVPQKWNFLV